MEFKQAVVTQNGRALMAKLLAGKSTQFTKIKVSSTIYPDAQLANLTALTNIEQETTAQAYGNNTATVSVVGAIENTGLTSGYYINTVGLYAQDPDKGEILYSVSSASVNGYMPPDTGVSKSGFEFKIYTEVGNATKVDLTVDPAAFATREDLERMKADYYNRFEIADLLAQIISGEEVEITNTATFANKVLGSVIENPHSARYSTSSTLANPNQGYGGVQNSYNEISFLDGTSWRLTTKTAEAPVQMIFNWNLIEQISRDYPGLFDLLGAVDLSKKVEVAKRIVSVLEPTTWGFGSNQSGNSLTSEVWNKTGWSTGSAKNTTNQIKELKHTWTGSTATQFIQDDGFVYMTVFSEPSDGVSSSISSVDYTSLTYKLKIKLSDFYVPRNEYNQEIGEIKDWIQAHS
ncbi:hypothetical protein [Enterococcus sp. 2201sp1_2201st1_B8_2201SCRN_220225]|uniref:hypothetical protein n=1 Tax=unclassified Enterococcus TaxID=2608891 RepID=UPI0034A16C67